MVKEVQGWHCEKCRRFMLNEADMAAHLRSVTHYRNFVQELKSLTAAAEAAKKPAEDETVKHFRNLINSNRFCVKYLFKKTDEFQCSTFLKKFD